MIFFEAIFSYMALLVVKTYGQRTQTCLVSKNVHLQDEISDFWMFSDSSLRHNPPNVIECASRCLNDERCITFMLNENSTRCRLHAAHVSEYNLLQSVAGFVSYDTCRATSSTIGHPCETDASCSLQYTECVEYICQCQAGYSFSPSLKSCVAVCPEYGSEFVGFKDYYIRRHNDLELNDAAYMCAECCQERCRQETRFLCVTAELLPGQCLLSSVTKLDVPDSYKYSTVYNVTHYQRQCSYG